MKDCIAEKMLKRIEDRLRWANQQRSYYLGVKDVLEKIKATEAIYTGYREKTVNQQIDIMVSIIWEMTYLLACYQEEDHFSVWNENYKAGYDYQMEGMM